MPSDEQYIVKANDRIGWTFEDDFGAISFNYSENHRTYFRDIDSDQEYPLVGNEYKFTRIHLPSIFSIGVQVLLGNYNVI